MAACFTLPYGCMQLQFLLMEELATVLLVHSGLGRDTIKGGWLIIRLVLNVVIENAHWRLQSYLTRHLLGFIQIALIIRPYALLSYLIALCVRKIWVTIDVRMLLPIFYLCVRGTVWSYIIYWICWQCVGILVLVLDNWIVRDFTGVSLPIDLWGH